MFREMRRKKQVLNKEECITILENGITGVLAVSGDNDYPYTVPLNYVYYKDKLYFHWAKSGHKLDAINKNEKVSFCVISEDKVIPEKFTTFFRSVVVFGKAHIIEEETKKKEMMKVLSFKYHPSATNEEYQKALDHSYKAVCMVEVDIEYMSGKEELN